MTTSYTVTADDARDDTDATIREQIAYSTVLRQEYLPDDPEPSFELVATLLRETPAHRRLRAFRVRDGQGRLVAHAATGIDGENDDNPDLLEVELTVDPQHRRRRLGLQLLAELVALARDEGRTRLFGETEDPVAAGEAFARAIGAEARSSVHVNALRIADVDRAMLERWVAEGPVRAPEYELIVLDGAIPDELLVEFTDLVIVMNDAPRDDVTVNDFTITPEEMRDSERRLAAAQVEVWTVIARHVPTGALVGFHDVSWVPSRPAMVGVSSTGVRREHRGHALGKWMKATMTLWIMDARPEVTEIRTGNADSNDAMLGINHQMGYRPLIARTTWEISVDAAEKLLAERGIRPTTISLASAPMSSETNAKTTMRQVAPYFMVPDVHATAAYYRDMLGFSVDRFYGDPPSFVIVSRDDVSIMLKEIPVDHVLPDPLPEGYLDAYIWVTDVNALAAEYKAKGVTFVAEPEDQEEYNGRDMHIRDCNDRIICFGQIYD